MNEKIVTINQKIFSAKWVLSLLKYGIPWIDDSEQNAFGGLSFIFGDSSCDSDWVWITFD